MKKVINIIPLTVFLCGCGGNPINARNEVLNTFPNSEITPLSGKAYQFIVRDTNEAIWEVNCLNFMDDKISAKTQLFPAKQ
jgi:hypothetical protein